MAELSPLETQWPDRISLAQFSWWGVATSQPGVNWAVAGLLQNSLLPNFPRATPLEALSLHCSWANVDVFQWASSQPGQKEGKGAEAQGSHPGQEGGEEGGQV